MTREIDTTARARYRRQIEALERIVPDLFIAAAKRSKKRANVHGGSKDPNRGKWCTPKAWADRLGRFDVDPFSNARSNILSSFSCALETGGQGLDLARGPGAYRIAAGIPRKASSRTRVFIQPPYEIVTEAIAHYGHTRFTALLRFDPSTEWFLKLYRLTQLVCVPRERMDFDPPPGVQASSNSFPHAFYFARAEDAPAAILRRCIAWKTR